MLEGRRAIDAVRLLNRASLEGVYSSRVRSLTQNTNGNQSVSFDILRTIFATDIGDAILAMRNSWEPKGHSKG